MSLEKVRDVVLIVCAIIFVISYSVPVFFPNWYYERSYGAESYLTGANTPNIYTDCQSSDDNKNILTITVDNYGSENLENIGCTLLDKGDLISSEDSQIIASLTPGSSDLCTFSLDGKYERPLKVRVDYNEESITQAVTCYPSYY